jgi:hypothetical protein
MNYVCINTGGGQSKEILRNLETEFVLAKFKELQLTTPNVLPFVYTF